MLVVLRGWAGACRTQTVVVFDHSEVCPPSEGELCGLTTMLLDHHRRSQCELWWFRLRRYWGVDFTSLEGLIFSGGQYRIVAFIGCVTGVWSAYTIWNFGEFQKILSSRNAVASSFIGQINSAEKEVIRAVVDARHLDTRPSC